MVIPSEWLRQSNAAVKAIAAPCHERLHRVRFEPAEGAMSRAPPGLREG
ncbi:MAG TPA: hypothetical protein VF815_41595 [Myxococcaceae bacterium]